MTTDVLPTAQAPSVKLVAATEAVTIDASAPTVEAPAHRKKLKPAVPVNPVTAALGATSATESVPYLPLLFMVCRRLIPSAIVFILTVLIPITLLSPVAAHRDLFVESQFYSPMLAACVTGMAASFLIIVETLFHFIGAVRAAMRSARAAADTTGDAKQKAKSAVTTPHHSATPLWRRLLSTLSSILLLASFILFCAALMLQGLYWQALITKNTNAPPARISDSTPKKLAEAIKKFQTAAVVLSSLALVFTGFEGSHRLFQITSGRSRAYFVFVLLSIMLLILGELIAVVNQKAGVHLAYTNFQWSCIAVTRHSGTFSVAAAVFALGLSAASRQAERISGLFERLVSIWRAFAVLAMLLSLIAMVMSAIFAEQLGDDAPLTEASIDANPPMTGICVGLLLLLIIASNKLDLPPKSHLSTEVLDLTKLSPKQITELSQAIDAHGRTDADALTGDAALNLMTVYQTSKINNVRVLVLRVFRSAINKTDTQRQAAATTAKAAQKAGGKGGAPTTAAPSLQRYDSASVLMTGVRERFGRHHHSVAGYEEETMWQKLDELPRALQHSTSTDLLLHDKHSSSQPAPPGGASGASTPTPDAAAPAPVKVSKKQQKKQARLAKAETAELTNVDEDKDNNTGTPLLSLRRIVVEPVVAEDAVKLEGQTEALVMLTRIDNYDLTLTLPRWLGSILRRTLGTKSPLPQFLRPLSARFGLIGIHWPFRSAIFMCTPSSKPVARSAAVLRAITEWNDALPSAERCLVLLHPTYAGSSMDKAVAASKWTPTVLPPTHVVDLRPYRGKTAQEYMKAIQYRDQSAAFRKANGTVEISMQFTDAECHQCITRWQQIAERRTVELEETPTLATPDQAFIQHLGTGNQPDGTWRQLMMLKVDGETVATCVLFNLGNTLTTDIQGLDHAKARPVKAYYVMMQHVIDRALALNMSFVDFGPTTGPAKVGIGAVSIPITGAMYSHRATVRWGVQVATKLLANKHQE